MRRQIAIVVAITLVSAMVAALAAEVLMLRARAISADQVCSIATSNRVAIRSAVRRTAEVARLLVGPGNEVALERVDDYERSALVDLTLPPAGCP